MSKWRMALLLISGVGYAILSYWMMLYHAAAPWAIFVLLGPLWLTALGLGASRFGKWGFTVTAVIGIGLFALVLRGDAGDPNRLYVFQHVGINVLLCGWFGSTLRGDRLSLIGQFAQRVHAMTASMRTYTAQVTTVWSLYFALMAFASVVVYATMSFAAWSLLSNLVSPVMIGVLFIGEHLVRYRIHPEFERTRLIDALRASIGAPVERPADR
jgi:uncharacterized membrane protein